MPHWLPAAIFGTAVALFGLGLSRRNFRAWHEWQADDMCSETDRLHYRIRYQRRAQLAGMIITTGVLLALGDAVIWGFGIIASTVFWIMVLVLCCWIGLLALGDLTSVYTQHHVAMKRVEKTRQELEAQLQELRRSEDS